MLAAWILYQSVYGMVTAFIFIPLCIQREKRKRQEQQKETLLLQFRDAMQSVAAALQAGYSMENAWRESEKEMTELYGQDGIFVGELHQINQAVGMNQPIENCYMNLRFAAIVKIFRIFPMFFCSRNAVAVIFTNYSNNH